MSKRRVHDLIVGVLVTLGVALGYWANAAWLLLPGAVGVLLIQSGFTGFCPVYFVLDRVMGMEPSAGGAKSPAR